MLTGNIRNLRSESTAVIDGVWRHLVRTDNAVLHANAMIIFTKGRHMVDDASTISIRHLGVCKHSECFTSELWNVRASRRTYGAKKANLFGEVVNKGM